MKECLDYYPQCEKCSSFRFCVFCSLNLYRKHSGKYTKRNITTNSLYISRLPIIMGLDVSLFLVHLYSSHSNYNRRWTKSQKSYLVIRKCVAMKESIGILCNSHKFGNSSDSPHSFKRSICRVNL